MTSGLSKGKSYYWLLLLSGYLFSQNPQNHAIVIGIDSYEYWNVSTTVKANIDEALDYFNDSKYNFNLHPLRNEQATKQGVKNLFEGLNLAKGDRVFLYMIGHGAQIDDLEGDEKDGWDEVFVCHDSPKVAHSDFRKKSLLDDDINQLLNGVRKKIGQKGQVFMLVESCHSSTLDRFGVKVEFEDYGQRWQSAFMAEKENIKNQDFAPLIIFSSSRANAQTPAYYKFSNYFLSEFKKFNGGSYHKLFSKFYAAQQKKFSEVFGTDVPVSLTVNLHVEQHEYLNYGVFSDTIYNDKIGFRIIEIDPRYPIKARIKLNRGVYTGLTNGSRIKMIKNNSEYGGRIEKVASGSAWADLSENASLPNKEDLWDMDLQMDGYRYMDTLRVHLDPGLTNRKALKKAVNEMDFVKLGYHEKGYKIVEVENSGNYVVRNRDNIGLYKASDLNNTLLKLQIGKFLRKLATQRDSVTTIVVRKSNTELNPNISHQLVSGDSLAISVKTTGKKQEANKYFVILQIEDEFVKQLVPVNFQINDSECRLPNQANTEVPIGTIVTHELDGRLLLLTSNSPIDLREVLLKPLSKKKEGSKDELNELELLIDRLFLNRTNNNTLYDPENLLSSEFRYVIK